MLSPLAATASLLPNAPTGFVCGPGDIGVLAQCQALQVANFSNCGKITGDIGVLAGCNLVRVDFSGCSEIDGELWQFAFDCDCKPRLPDKLRRARP